MHLFIEEGIRGGVAMISHRMVEAKNKYMNDFNVEKPSNYHLSRL